MTPRGPQWLLRSQWPPNYPKNPKNDLRCFVQNIARGTTDPGYWVFNLNYLVDQIEFIFIHKITQVSDSVAWVRCATTWIGWEFGHLHWYKFSHLGNTCISCNFGHKVVPPESVENWATKWHYFKIWSSGGATCVAWFQSWPPGCVTRIATLPWNALIGHCPIGIIS